MVITVLIFRRQIPRSAQIDPQLVSPRPKHVSANLGSVERDMLTNLRPSEAARLASPRGSDAVLYVRRRASNVAQSDSPRPCPRNALRRHGMDKSI